MQGLVPSKKKIPFPVSDRFKTYLRKYNREVELPLKYADLQRYTVSMALLDTDGNDTLWETVYFQDNDQVEIYKALTEIYALLKTDGDTAVLQHLTVARIDYCTFGNTQPFRIRIINRLNDNYDHFYVKRMDSSRLFGLELEYLLSPDYVRYLIQDETLIEEHVAGIPGDDFMKKQLDVSKFEQIRITKEFVKFNERCFVRLLGDMRAYNYVVDITPDIEGSQYRFRAIDFDQQSYEGRKQFYLPQYFKENNPINFLGFDLLDHATVTQYQLEERSLIAVRIKNEQVRFEELMKILVADRISDDRKVAILKKELGAHHQTDVFQNCDTMGAIILAHLNLLLAKDFKQSIELGS
jgi:hypothetical protein